MPLCMWCNAYGRKLKRRSTRSTEARLCLTSCISIYCLTHMNTRCLIAILFFLLVVCYPRSPESTILQALKWLRKQTAAAFPVGARMQVSPEQAQFLAWLVKVTRTTKALELGVFTGYSALAVALVSFALAGFCSQPNSRVTRQLSTC